jgi:hypothetical protein
MTVFPSDLQILLRKGGIREPTFTPKAQRFFMFPTSFHSEQQLLKPGMAEQYQQVCRCLACTLYSPQDGAAHVLLYMGSRTRINHQCQQAFCISILQG